MKGDLKPKQDRLLYFEDLAERKGIKMSPMSIWRAMRAKDHPFPQNRLIGQRKAWLESEIDAWLARLPAGKGRTPPRKEAGKCHRNSNDS